MNLMEYVVCLTDEIEIENSIIWFVNAGTAKEYGPVGCREEGEQALSCAFEYVRVGARRVSNKRAAVTFQRGMAGEAVQRARGSHSSRGRHGGAGDESVAVLMLALAYIIAISLIVGALADWAMNDLNNTTKFNSTGQLHSVVSSVTNLAIQNIRDTPEPSNPPNNAPTGLGTCWAPY